MKAKLYKLNRRCICYITSCKGVYTVSTGKPSDVCCFSWIYHSLEEAEKTAEEYYNNYCNI